MSWYASGNGDGGHNDHVTVGITAPAVMTVRLTVLRCVQGTGVFTPLVLRTTF